MKNIQINESPIGAQSYHLVEMVNGDTYVYPQQLGIPSNQATAADIQINNTSIGQQDYTFVEKTSEGININNKGLIHKAIDLGLPSGILWADRNIGASSPEDSGLYFQWGDTQGYTAEQVGYGEGLKAFDWADYKFSIDGSTNFSKYNASDRKTVLDPEDDAAHVNMGGSWRMPTENEFIELCMNTDIYLVPTEGEEIKGTVQEDSGNPSLTISWETEPSSKNIKGVKFYKKGDKQTYMFVPAAGDANEGSMQNVGQIGLLWSSSLYSSGVRNAWDFYFNANNGGVYYGYRYGGLPVRGVFENI